MDDKFEQKISEAFKKATDKSTKELHEENFQMILNKIDKIDKGEMNMPRKKTALGKIITIGTVAAVLLFTLSTQTQPGQAALEKIRQYFEPEKQIVDQIEGMDEVIEGKLQESEMGYVLYYDQKRYKIVEEDNVDRIEMIEKFDNMPDVYMEISQDKDRTPEEVVTELAETLKADFSKVDAAKNVNDPVEAIHIHAINGGTNADDVVVNYYLVDNTKGGTFIIEQKYFLEASEGHGTRFYNMLKEFVVVPADPAE